MASAFSLPNLRSWRLIIALAWYGERFQRQMPTWRRGIAVPGLLICVVLGLVFVEPDRGTTILLAAVSGALLLLAGVRWKHIMPPRCAGTGWFGLSLWHDPMRMRRISAGWISRKTKTAWLTRLTKPCWPWVRAAGPVWAWAMAGRSSGFVPEHHTDFIFSIIGEELGLIATLLVVVAFVVLLVCGIYIARNARDTFGLLFGAGISFLIGLQAFINIGVVTSALPNKGLPLPFISYGGSNLLLLLTCIGVLLSIARHSPAYEAAADGAVETDEIPLPRLSRC